MMQSIIILNTPQSFLNIQLETQLHVTADSARRQVNREVIPELGTGLIARTPELVVENTQVSWRVPVHLSLPQLGDLGQVGTVTIDAVTGSLHFI